MTLAVIHSRHVTDDAVALAGLATNDGTTITTHVAARPGNDPEARRAAVLDMFELLNRHAQTNSNHVLVHVTDGDVRRELEAVRAAFPAVTLVHTPRGRFLELLHAATDALAEHTTALHSDAGADTDALPDPAALPELVVATDASKCSARRGVGVACVRSDGQHRQKVIPHVGSVLLGELLAIELAVASFPNRRLHVLSDSRAALTCLQPASRPNGEVATTVDRIRRRTRGLPVRYSWVPGHAGHPLNEAAHRLAVAARRGHEAGIDPQIRSAVAENIVAPLVGCAA